MVFSRRFLPLVAAIRNPLILKMIRAMPESKLRMLFREIFDPNTIRKKIDYRFSERLVKVSTNSYWTGTLVVDINDHLGHRYFLDRDFDSTAFLAGAQIGIESSDIFLDIGANIGTTCIPFAKFFNCEVIAVEASSKNASILLRNSIINRVKLRLHIVCATDYNTQKENSFLPFFSKNGNSGANSIFKNWNPSVTHEDLELVCTSTVDQLLANVESKRIKLIKIDVEGAEDQVLRGFESIKDLVAPLIIEYRLDLMEKYLNDTGITFIALLMETFSLFSLVKIEGKLYLGNFDPDLSQENLIGFPKKHLDMFLGKFPTVDGLAVKLN